MKPTKNLRRRARQSQKRKEIEQQWLSAARSKMDEMIQNLIRIATDALVPDGAEELLAHFGLGRADVKAAVEAHFENPETNSIDKFLERYHRTIEAVKTYMKNKERADSGDVEDITAEEEKGERNTSGVPDVPESKPTVQKIILSNSEKKLLNWIRSRLTVKPSEQTGLIHIPRVRFGTQKDKSLLMIHTGIEQFLRFEFIGKSRKTVVKKLQDSWEAVKITEKVVDSADHLHVALQILKSLFGPGNTLLQVLEVDIEDQQLMETFEKSIRNTELRAKSVTFVTGNGGVKLFSNVSDCESVKGIRVEVGNDHELVPLHACRFFPSINDVNTLCQEPLSSKHEEKFIESAENCTLSGVDSTYLKGRFEELASSAKVIRVNEKVTCHRIVRRGIVLRYNKSPCGYWLDAMTPKLEEQVKDKIERTVCNIGFFCKNCTDPFEYAYYRDLPQRIVREKEWVSIFGSASSRSANKHLAGFRKNMEATLTSGEKIDYPEDVWKCEEPDVQHDSETSKLVREVTPTVAQSVPEKVTSSDSVSPEPIVTSDDTEESEEKVDRPEDDKHFVALCERMMMNMKYNQPRDELLDLISSSLTLKPSVPRVRFGAQPGKALLMIHTCDRKFLRLEFDGKDDDKTLVKILQNTWDVSKIIEKTVDNPDHFAFAVSVLRELFEIESIVPDVLEWDFESEEIFHRLYQLLEDCQLTTKKVCIIGDGVVSPLAARQSEEVVRIRLGEKNQMFPQQLLQVSIDDKTKCNVFHLDPIPNFKSAITFIIDISLQNPDNLYTLAVNSPLVGIMFEQMSRNNEPTRVNQEVIGHRITLEVRNQNVVVRMNKSSCGYWIDATVAEKEAEFFETRKRVVCGVGYLCKKCTDPFEYEYYQSLPQRIAREKEWDAVFIKSKSFADHSDEVRQKMLKMFESGVTVESVLSDIEPEMDPDEAIYILTGTGKYQEHYSNNNENDPKWEENSKLEAISEEALLKWACESFHLRRKGSKKTVVVPRVRLTVRERRTLIEIHTAIGKFLRLEFWAESGHTIVYRYRDSWKDPKKRRVSSEDHTRMAILVLKSQLAWEHVYIDTFEFELTDEENVARHSKSVLDTLDGARFNVTQLTLFYSSHTNRDYLLNCSSICHSFQKLEFYCIAPNATSIVPFAVFDTHSIQQEKQVVCSIAFLSQSQTESCLDMGYDGIEDAYDTFRYADPFHLEKEFNELTEPSIQRNESVTCKRVSRDGGKYNLYHNSSPCGFWMDRVSKKNEKKYLKTTESTVCGLGFFCKKCADPFDYAYYRDIPKRAYYEHQWTGLFRTDITSLQRKHFSMAMCALQMKIQDELKNEELSVEEKPSEDRPLPAEDVTSSDTPLPAEDVTSSDTPLPAEDVTSSDTPLPAEDVTSSDTLQLSPDPVVPADVPVESDDDEKEEEEDEEDVCYEDINQRQFVEKLAEKEHENRFNSIRRRFLLVFFQLFLLLLVYTSFSNPIANTLFAVLLSFAMICFSVGWI